MATSKKFPKEGAAPPQGVATKAIRVVLEPTTDAPILYANYFEVAHGEHDFTVFAGRLPGKLGRTAQQEALASSEIVIEPEMQIVLSPSLVPGLIQALQIQLEAWTQTFGKPKVEKNG